MIPRIESRNKFNMNLFGWDDELLELFPSTSATTNTITDGTTSIVARRTSWKSQKRTICFTSMMIRETVIMLPSKILTPLSARSVMIITKSFIVHVASPDSGPKSDEIHIRKIVRNLSLNA